MKHLLAALALAGFIWPPQADARCASVACHNAVVEQFVAVPAAIVTGMPSTLTCAMVPAVTVGLTDVFVSAPSVTCPT